MLDISNDAQRSMMSRPYDRLLQKTRPAGTTLSGRNLEEEADSDRGRILFSAPFRRLQNKAQVFSLEQNAAVRSRLIHSLEVSSIGKYIAQQILARFEKKDQLEPLGLVDKERPFITFVETACLLHDVGNPPFGHFGERAIGEWFRRQRDTFRTKSPIISQLGDIALHQWDRHYADLRNFDGNPQGFRIVTQLQQDRADANQINRGANLTLTQLAAMIKYPIFSSQAINSINHKKGGYFITESHIVKKINDTLGLKAGQRHPLVYVMEAADDIAYCMSDLEDGVEKDIISPTHFAHFVDEKIEKIDFNNEASNDYFAAIVTAVKRILNDDPNLVIYDILWDLRAKLIHALVHKAADLFVANHEKILDEGPPESLLQEQCPETELLETLKRYAETRLYNSNHVRSREITAFKVLHGLLDAFLPLLLCKKDRFEAALEGKHTDQDGRNITVESSLASRLPRKYLDAYKHACQTDDFEADAAVREWSLRAHLILDYIGGMTDQYALRTFQLVSGVRIDDLP